MAEHLVVESVGSSRTNAAATTMPTGRQSESDRTSVSTDTATLTKSPHEPGTFVASLGLEFVGRHSLGIFFLLVTVVLWTASNFLASYVFADDTYAKPYFVTYINTSSFALSLPFTFLRLGKSEGAPSLAATLREVWHHNIDKYRWRGKRESLGDRVRSSEDGGETSSGTRLLVDHDHEDEEEEVVYDRKSEDGESMLNVPETAKLSLEFALLWFLANYFVAACLEYTTVSSASILTATSSIWTLIFGAIFRIEGFTMRKLIGVLASTSGVILISMLDLSGQTDENRGSFPHKTAAELAVGNSMALLSAVFYGIYSVLIKKRIGNEDRIDMPLFFGLVGLFNVIFLWPGFLILHFTGIETFQLPPTGKIWAIVLINSISSLVADYTWAWAMLLTTPLIVTVGLSLTIPLSIVGQMLFSSQYSSWLYWVGALIVVASFLFIERESHDATEDVRTDDRTVEYA